jgi:DNA invertase Pin-like site-specific DNA recombinase
VGQH